MPEYTSIELPLDLLRAGRDELVDGSGPVRIVPQLDPTAERLEPAKPNASQRCGTAQRELRIQSAVLQSVVEAGASTS